MRYLVAGALPLSSGGSQDRLTSRFPGVAVRLRGAPGRPSPHTGSSSGPALTQSELLARAGLVAGGHPVLVLDALFRAFIDIARFGVAGVLHQGVVVPGLPMGTLGTAVLPAGAATLYAVAGDRGAVRGLPGQPNPGLLLDRTQVFEPPLVGSPAGGFVSSPSSGVMSMTVSS